jgi:hypothetical protein
MSKPKRIKMLELQIGTFIKQYARKKHAGHDPNDRSYDRNIEKKIKNMNPEELSHIINEDEDFTEQMPSADGDHSRG